MSKWKDPIKLLLPYTVDSPTMFETEAFRIRGRMFSQEKKERSPHAFN